MTSAPPPGTKPAERLASLDTLTLAGVVSTYQRSSRASGVALLVVMAVAFFATLQVSAAVELPPNGKLLLGVPFLLVVIPGGWAVLRLQRRRLYRYAAVMDLDPETVDAIVSAGRRFGAMNRRQQPSADDVAHGIKAWAEESVRENAQRNM